MGPAILSELERILVHNKQDQAREFAARVTESLEPFLRQQLRRRYSALAPDHEDLLQDTLLDLIEYMKRRWDRQPSDQETAAIALTILKRRVADRFRSVTRTAAETLLTDELPSPFDGEAMDAALRYRKLLWAVLSVLVDLDDEDQGLLLRQELSHSVRLTALTSAERKRISRLREHLRQQLRERFGISLEEYFKD